MRKALRLTSLLVLCAMALPAVAQLHNFWTSGASMPTAVYAPSGVGVLGGQIYVVGGLNSSNTAIANTQIHNPSTNTWSAGVSLPTALADGVGAVVKGKLYIIGGTTADANGAHMPLTNNPGRVAGLLYTLASVPVFFALMYVPSKIFVRGDATATANNISAHETLFRLGNCGRSHRSSHVHLRSPRFV